MGIGDWINIEQSNGYLGAIDPEPYFNGQFVSTTTGPKLVFTKDLYLGVTDPEVLTLQKWLNGHGFTIAKSGAGSPGHETDYYGPLTQAAVIQFQRAKGITPTAGFVSRKSRAYLNANP